MERCVSAAPARTAVAQQQTAQPTVQPSWTLPTGVQGPLPSALYARQQGMRRARIAPGQGFSRRQASEVTHRHIKARHGEHRACSLYTSILSYHPPRCVTYGLVALDVGQPPRLNCRQTRRFLCFGRGNRCLLFRRVRCLPRICCRCGGHCGPTRRTSEGGHCEQA